MPDLIFEDSRLVSIYDIFDGRREDLDHYVSLIKELKAKSVLDLGCGTGCLANLLAKDGINVVAVDPAKASLDFARKKINSENIQWVLGDATILTPMTLDLAIMTGNVAQVFISDSAWQETLAGVRRALRKGGYFIFEVRDPDKKAWLEWTKEKTRQRIYVPQLGYVEGWCEVMDVSKDLVSFRWTYIFESGGAILFSDSTLRFRERDTIENSLLANGFILKKIQDAPDRPGKEFVFIATST